MHILGKARYHISKPDTKQSIKMDLPALPAINLNLAGSALAFAIRGQATFDLRSAALDCLAGSALRTTGTKENTVLFTETRLKGAYIIDLSVLADNRGFFARTFDIKEFEAHGLKPTIAQCSMAYNHRQGTLRGIHYQLAPSSEARLVRCTRGAIYQVIIDLRPDSYTFGSHIGIELSAENHRALYIPEYFARGFQTLTDDTEVVCQISASYSLEGFGGLRYDDPSFGLEWPLPVTEVSEEDKNWPQFEGILVYHEGLYLDL